MKKRPPDTAVALALPRPIRVDAGALIGAAVPVMLVLAAWLAVHPYHGIVHDGRLYVAQALNRLRPDIFGADLFFAFGSQDAFTLFTYLFAPLVAGLGPQQAAGLVVFVGQAIWLGGLYFLVRRLAVGAGAVFVGMLLVVTMPNVYGGWNIFSYAEGFATPRLLAEGLSLWALGALAGRRPGVASLLALAATLLHPLMGATVLAAGWLFLALRDRRWWWLGVAGGVAVAAACAAGIAPFDRLLRTMDPEWLAIAMQRNAPLFPSLWNLADWSRIATATVFCVAGLFLLSGDLRRQVLAVVTAGLLGLAAMYVGADLLHNLFAIQVQPFRALWLLHVFGYISAGIVLDRLWRLETDGGAVIALVVAAWLIGLAILPALGPIVMAAALAIAVARLRGRLAPLPRAMRAVSVAIAALVVGFLIVYRVHALAGRIDTLTGIDGGLMQIWQPTVLDGTLVPVLLAAFVRCCRPGATRVLVPPLALLLLVTAVAGWDRRSEWTRTLTEQAPLTAFDAYLAPDALVYWEGDVRGAWLLLGRPSYVSKPQGAGLVFNRETALAVRGRARIVAPLTDVEMLDTFAGPDRPPRPVPVIGRATLVGACRADSALDAVVLPVAIDGIHVAEWRLAQPIHNVPSLLDGFERPALDRFYLYRCADLR